MSSVVKLALKARAIRETQYNIESSRSHVICVLNIYRGSRVFVSLKLADLAGHERYTTMEPSSDRLLETDFINKSLDNLNKAVRLSKHSDGKNEVLDALCNESILTRLLKDSIGGNTRSWWLATISPSNVDYKNTVSTLNFMENVRMLRYSVKANTNLIESFEKKILMLSEKLDQKMKEPDNSRLTQLQKRDRRVKLKAMQKELEECQRKVAELQRAYSSYPISISKQLHSRIRYISQETNRAAQSKEYFITNISRDPFLSGRIIHFLDSTETVMGSGNDAGILIVGMSVQARHCTLTNNSTTTNPGVSISSPSNALTRVNGVALKVGEKHVLKIGDVITLGTMLHFQLMHSTVKNGERVLAVWDGIYKHIFKEKLLNLSSNLRMLLEKMSVGKNPQQIQEQLRWELLMVIIDVEEANKISKVLVILCWVSPWWWRSIVMSY